MFKSLIPLLVTCALPSISHAGSPGSTVATSTRIIVVKQQLLVTYNFTNHGPGAVRLVYTDPTGTLRNPMVAMGATLPVAGAKEIAVESVVGSVDSIVTYCQEVEPESAHHNIFVKEVGHTALASPNEVIVGKGRFRIRNYGPDVLELSTTNNTNSTDMFVPVGHTVDAEFPGEYLRARARTNTSQHCVFAISRLN